MPKPSPQAPVFGSVPVPAPTITATSQVKPPAVTQTPQVKPPVVTQTPQVKPPVVAQTPQTKPPAVTPQVAPQAQPKAPAPVSGGAQAPGYFPGGLVPPTLTYPSTGNDGQGYYRPTALPSLRDVTLGAAPDIRLSEAPSVNVNIPFGTTPFTPTDRTVNSAELEQRARLEAGLKVDPALRGLQQQLEQAQLSYELQRAGVDPAYARAIQDLQQQAQQSVSTANEMANARGLSNSTIAMALANRAAQPYQQQIADVYAERARELAAIAARQGLDTRQLAEQMAHLEAQRGVEQQALYNTLMDKAISRNDMLAGRDFDQWTAQQQLALSAHQANTNNALEEARLRTTQWQTQNQMGMDAWRAQQERQLAEAQLAMQQNQSDLERWHTANRLGLDTWQAAADDRLRQAYFLEQQNQNTFNRWLNQNQFQFDVYRDGRNYNYGVGRDSIADQKWAKEFQAQQQQKAAELNNALQRALIAARSGGGGGGGGGGGDSNTASIDATDLLKLFNRVNDYQASGLSREAATSNVANELNAMVRAGAIDPKQAAALSNAFGFPITGNVKARPALPFEPSMNGLAPEGGYPKLNPFFDPRIPAYSKLYK